MTRVRQPALPFVVIGVVSTTAGGLLSAVSALSPGYTAAWAVAYLVLVGGLAQVALGLGQARLALGQPAARMILAEGITFNLANIAVLAGTVLGWMALVDIGGGLLAVALALFLWGVRSARRQGNWMLYGFRIVIAALIVSTPIGLVIASVRAG